MSVLGVDRRALEAIVAALAVSLAAPACKRANEMSQPPVTAIPDTASFENPGGMWMPRQMNEQAATLKTLGVGFDPATLADPTSFPLGAVVSLGGCSASFVSPEGLVVTNHHCVIGALQQNSTPDHNLLALGHLAATRADEKPAGASQRIYVTQAITDVTGEITQGLEGIADPQARYLEIQKRTLAIQQRCEQASAGHSCTVRPFFEGAEYHLTDALEIRDVRLVYAPDAGIGVFGGEVDNWRWPRHTGDFSFFRAYVGKDGKPADPSPDNVPYKPPHHLSIAKDPLKPGDFVMVAGYPGRTNRLSTADEVADAISWRYPRDIERYGETLATLEQLGKQRPELAIKTASRMRRLANYHTNFQGMLEGLQKGGLAEQKSKQQQELRAWIDGDAARKAKYGPVFDELAKIDAENRKTRDRDAVLKEIAENGQLFALALAVATTAGDPTRLGELEAAAQHAARGYDPELDRALLSLALRRAQRLPADVRPDDVIAAFVGDAAKQGDAAIDDAVAKLYTKTKLGDAKARDKLLGTKSPEALAKHKDPFVKAAVALRDSYVQLKTREEVRLGQMALLRPKFVTALREHSKTPIAPDANGTLRITYGTVKGYKPSPDAPAYEPFTTLAQMIAKHTGTEPFNAPARLLAAAKADKGPYLVPELGDVPLDFLADLDITGGNSGSATLNAKGELVGLAFDGNYESIASNWLFIPGITRSIHVDVRFILWVLDAVDEGDHLLKEMGIEPKLAAVGAGDAPPAAAPATAPAPATKPTVSAPATTVPAGAAANTAPAPAAKAHAG
ncbi:MAG TPA: S46 family peptidase [Nannocystaceae bacterium]|nr:S46 family peptidase [Nannocystaceae bacterium]